jgi:SET domain-containing protein
VIAIRDIPKGTNPFRIATADCRKYDVIDVAKSEVDRLPDYAARLIKDFIQPTPSGVYKVPAQGFNAIDISFYLNHSDHPNVDIINPKNSSCEFMMFRTNTIVKKGKELFISYSF